MKQSLFVSTIALLTLYLASCTDAPKNPIADLPAIKVKVRQLQESNTPGMLSASGKIEAVNSANISTRMMGYVTSVKVKTGDQVKSGQLLATINSADLQAKKAQADAGIAQATSAYNSARRDYERFTVLHQQKSVSQKEMDDIATHYEMMKSQLEAARQMKNEVMAQFAYSNITAPFAGVVTATYLKEGDMAHPGMPVLSIEGGSKLQAVVMVPENEIAKLKQGITADINLKSLQQTIPGKVAEISKSALHTGGQYTVKVDLNRAHPAVLSGMFVNVSFSVPGHPADADDNRVLIPQEAIITEGQLKGVYVVGENKTAILRWLRLGKNSGGHVEVLSGLNAGETYILQSDGRLFNGAKVEWP